MAIYSVLRDDWGDWGRVKYRRIKTGNGNKKRPSLWNLADKHMSRFYISGNYLTCQPEHTLIYCLLQLLRSI